MMLEKAGVHCRKVKTNLDQLVLSYKDVDVWFFPHNATDWNEVFPEGKYNNN
jgi:hypothetical protein